MKKLTLTRARDAWLVPFLVVSLIALSFIPARAYPVDTLSKEAQIVALTNEMRIINGLSPLQIDPLLREAAEAKAKDMAKNNYFAHYFNNQTPWDYIDGFGITEWKTAGENLGKNYRQADALVEAWMSSPTHRANILNSTYDRVGVAMVRVTLSSGRTVTLTVQMFTGA